MPPGRKLLELGDRLWAKIARGQAHKCWPWTGAKSKSGRRKVYYGAIREQGQFGRVWKAHRLVLVLATGPGDVPSTDGESFLDWLQRANAYYKGLEAAHQCDNSLCCNPGHLAWETHGDNLANQRAREACRRLAEELVA